MQLQRLLPVAVGDAGDVVAGQKLEIRVILEGDRALHHIPQGAHDRLQALPVQRQLGELPVDVDRAAELDVLLVDDPLQDGAHDLQVGDVLGDGDQRDPVFLGLDHHLVRDLAQVALRLQHQA